MDRNNEYVQISLQTDREIVGVVAVNEKTRDSVYCQVVEQYASENRNVFIYSLIFPVSVKPGEEKNYRLSASEKVNRLTDLSVRGEDLELIIENEYYRADLTRSDDSEAKNHASGQLRELTMKMGFGKKLFRTENRMHWAPNFQKPELEYYTTIAGWDLPEFYRFEKGPYLIRTERKGKAPSHPEILLAATYDFYAGKPYFIFYSEMEMVEDLDLVLLRNDEMTMDSLFTHVAFQRPDGSVIDLPFQHRYDILSNYPIENDAPWLCFYHADGGYAFGSIRLKYDNTNGFGEQSPTFLPFTKISDGAEGGKYWNRLLIHDRTMHVAAGSRYMERNAYIVFRVSKDDQFSVIQHYSFLLSHPLRVTVLPD